MATRIVSTQTEFLAAMKAASGGDRILLEDGDYGSVLLDPLYMKTMRTYASEVTVAAVNPGRVTFDNIDLRRADHVTLQGIEVKDTLKIWMDSENIDVNGVKARTFDIRNVDEFTLTNSEATGGRFGLLMNAVSNFTVRNNYLHEVIEDVVRITGNSYGGTFENNIVYDTQANNAGLHNDLLQMFWLNGKTPHDIIIRENLFFDDPSTGAARAQGVFLSDAGAGYSDILIEQNLVSSAMVNSVYVRGAVDNVVIRNNTLTGDHWGHGGLIRIAAGKDGSGVTVEGNVARGVMDETRGANVSGNSTYGVSPYFVARNDPDALFLSPDAKDWTAFLPKENSVIHLDSGYGATDFLKALSAGTATLGIAAVTGIAIPENLVRPDFSYTGKTTFNGAWSSIVTLDDSESLHLDSGTIALNFTADTLWWRRGLVSKDSEGVSNGFSAWIEQGVLKIVFEGDTLTQTLTSDKVKAGVEHTLVTSFGNGRAEVWLDGESLGSVGTGMDWTKNDDKLVVGGQNAVSDEGTSNARRYAFDGEIHELAIYDHTMTATDYTQLLA